MYGGKITLPIAIEALKDLINKGYFKNEEEINGVLNAIKKTLGG